MKIAFASLNYPKLPSTSLRIPSQIVDTLERKGNEVIPVVLSLPKEPGIIILWWVCGSRCGYQGYGYASENGCYNPKRQKEKMCWKANPPWRSDASPALIKIISCVGA